MSVWSTCRRGTTVGKKSPLQWRANTQADVSRVLYSRDEKFAAFCVAEVGNVSKCSSESTQSIVTFFYDVEVTRDAKNETVYSVVPINDTSTGTPYVDTQAGVDKRMAAVMADNSTGPLAKLFFDTNFGVVCCPFRSFTSFTSFIHTFIHSYIHACLFIRLM